MQNKNNKTIKLLYCASDNNSSSGAFLCMVSLLKELMMFDIEPLVILPNRGNGFHLLDEAGIRYKYIKSLDWCKPIEKKKKYLKHCVNIVALFKLIKIILKEKINLIHLNTTFTYIGAIAGLITQKPVIWHLREAIEQAFGFEIIFGRFGYNLINHSNKIIAISNAVLNSYPMIDKNKAIVINDGIEDKKFYKPEKEILNNNHVKLLCVGAIYTQKGQKDLLLACKELLKNGYTNWSLTVIGVGDYQMLFDLIEKEDLSHYVQILGYRSNIEDYMENSDITIVPSHFEGFGRVIVESMFSGNLVIVSNSGAIPEIIQNEQNGLLHNCADSYDIYKKIKWALENRESGKKIAKQGQECAINNYTAKINAEKIYDVYYEILRKQ